MVFLHRFHWLLWLACIRGLVSTISRPHIVFILADDLGWNDVGFHGSDEIPTPNIDALAFSGVVLNNYYVLPLCTPSRSALMTGLHPVHTGMQHNVLHGADTTGLPLELKLLPQYLRELGYSCHAVGKWHLGSFKKEYTPLFRGFSSHLGFWTGHQDYNDHTANETGFWGLDMRRGLEPAWDLYGKYSTDVFTEESVRLIKQHPPGNPLFLYLAHAAVHSANPYNPLPVPDDVAAKHNISDYNRRRFAGMLTKLDDSVGEVVKALKEKDMLRNSIIAFSTDNGGPAAGFNLNAASNWPLRGVKNTLWEGGVRGAGLVWSPLIKTPGRVSSELMHITDWLPTLLSATRADTRGLRGLDGVDMWKTISHNLGSNRTEVLHNIDDLWGISSIMVENWKLIQGSTYNDHWSSWYGPSGREEGMEYSPELVINSMAGKALAQIGFPLTHTKIKNLRKGAEVWCQETKFQGPNCKPLEAPCLFNIKTDPCERINLADKHPGILSQLENRLEAWKETAVPPCNTPIDPRGNPDNWDHVWTNFGDFI